MRRRHHKALGFPCNPAASLCYVFIGNISWYRRDITVYEFPINVRIMHYIVYASVFLRKIFSDALENTLLFCFSFRRCHRVANKDLATGAVLVWRHKRAAYSTGSDRLGPGVAAEICRRRLWRQELLPQRGVACHRVDTAASRSVGHTDCLFVSNLVSYATLHVMWWPLFALRVTPSILCCLAYVWPGHVITTPLSHLRLGALPISFSFCYSSQYYQTDEILNWRAASVWTSSRK